MAMANPTKAENTMKLIKNFPVNLRQIENFLFLKNGLKESACNFDEKCTKKDEWKAEILEAKKW